MLEFLIQYRLGRQCIFGIAGFSGRGNPHSTWAGQGAFRLTYTAANAAFIDHIRLLYQNLFTLAVQYVGFAELDSLVRCRAVFFTDNAGNSLGIWQTAVLVKKNIADLCDMLMGQG